MATNLQFIKSASTSSASTLDVTDCFSADYDVYMISSWFSSSSENGLGIRLIDSVGSVITGAEYDYAAQGLLSALAFGENRSTTATGFDYFQYNESSWGSSAISYIYNPYDSSSYTFFSSQSSGMYINGATTTSVGYKYIGVHHTAEQITGLQLRGISVASAMEVSVYGVK